MDECKLIEQYIEVGPDGEPPEGWADARLRDYGVHVWALVGYYRLVGDAGAVARSYEVPTEAVEAALAYYRRYRRYIDARLLLNSG